MVRRIVDHVFAATMVILWITLAVCLFAWVTDRPFPGTSDPVEEAMSLTLLVVDERGLGGSGVAIGNYHVLTAGHVVGDDPRNYKVKLGDREWDVLFARQLKGMDAVILTVQGSEPPPIVDTSPSITHGQRVLVTGHPWCGPVQVTHGVITGKSRWERDEWMTDADAAPGSSGCPVWNENGELIAIVVGVTIGRGSTFTLVLPISEVLSALEQPWRIGTKGTVGRGRGSRDGLYRPRYPAVQE